MSNQPIIGIVGLGTMGLGIAQVFAQAGFPVRGTDGQTNARTSAVSRLATTLAERMKAGKLAAEKRDATLARFAVVDTALDLAPADMVIEAIVESTEAKQALFASLEFAVSPTCVLATNTSSLSVAEIAKGLKHPDRVVGLHFFNPAPAMKLVELVAHAGTNAASLTTARTLTEAAGKVVIGCADRPGFIVNRCARPYYGEALALLEEGRSASDIDAAMLAAGYRLGPFSLIDLIGADINLAATRGLCHAMANHPRYHVFDALVAQVASGKLGRKTGRGFVFPDAVGPAPKDASSLALRIEATLVNEAASLLGEGGVDASGIDTALKLGLNFPRGPFETARLHGLPLIRATLTELAATAPSQLRGRYEISPALQQMTLPVAELRSELL